MSERQSNGRFLPGIRPEGAGRPAGVPNKKTVEFQETLAKHNFNVAETWMEMIEEAREFLEHGDRYDKMEAIKVITDITGRIADRVHPRLKSVEHKQANGHDHLSPQQKLEMLKAVTQQLEAEIARDGSNSTGDVRTVSDKDQS